MAQKTIKRLTLFFALILAMSLLTGCGFKGPTKVKSSYTLSEAQKVTGNRLCVIWNNKVTTFDPNTLAPTKEVSDIFSTKVNTTYDYGLDAADGMTFFRQIAVFMYESVFAAKYGEAYTYKYTVMQQVGNETKEVEMVGSESAFTDYFLGSKLSSFDVDPGHLILKTLEKTKIALNPNGINTAVSTIISAVKGISMAVLVAMWCLEFISQLVNERFTMETVLKSLMHLLCGILIIENATVLVSAFAETGNALSSAVDPGTAGQQFNNFRLAVKDKLINGVSSINVTFEILTFRFGIGSIWFDIGSLEVILYLVFPLITQLICAYKIISRMIMRMLELTVRITLAPIPLAFSAQRGFSPETIRYLRSVLACALEPLLMVIGVSCTSTIASVAMQIVGIDSIGGLFTGAISMSLAYLVLSSYLGTTKSLAQEVIAR